MMTKPFLVIDGGVVVFGARSSMEAGAFLDARGSGLVAEVLTEAQGKPSRSTSRRKSLAAKSAEHADL